jgi:MYXO-CTERM domain-containing protein
MIGGATRIVLEGENPVVDRRSMVFSAKDDKEKEEQEKAKEDEAAEQARTGMDAEDESMWPEDEEEYRQQPEDLEEKPGGCGCRVPGTPNTGRAGLLLSAGLLAALAFRRRKRAA